MTTCANCHTKSQKLQRCSNCKSAAYCSKKCQIDHWKTHKPSCKALDGKASSDPSLQDGKDNSPGGSQHKTVVSKAADPRVSQNPSEEFVWGVKITHNGNNVPMSERFITERLPHTHPIFRVGELCPLPQLYGISILIYNTRLHGGQIPKADNQPAVFLRIEPHDGFAPFSWQIDENGDCYVVRQDKRPLSKELVETMFEYHDSLLSSTYFEKVIDRTYPPGHDISPQAFKAFSDDFWEKEKAQGRIRPSMLDGR